MKNLLTVLVLLVSTVCVGQSYLGKDEQLIFSFQTSTNKQVYLVKEKTNKYIFYRFGTKDKIEFEFPGTEKDSWGLFQYSFFLRGGGTANEGIDLN